jgi:membrane protease YdiL (CAAX protease family)
MGWQPLVATWVARRWVDPPDALDLGFRRASPAFSIVGAFAALGLVGSAAGLVWLCEYLLLGEAPASGAASVTRLGSPIESIGVLLALLATLAMIAVQAVSEEVAWRGYFLPRAMQRLGNWRGLVLHGAVWGIWYAPVLFFATYGTTNALASLHQSSGFVVTCMFLGVLLGWLRLASQSLVPVLIANATLTLAAGLPYTLYGLEAGILASVFGPAGWAVTSATIATLLITRWRSAVQNASPLTAGGVLAPGAPPLRVFLQRPPGDNRTLN